MCIGLVVVVVMVMLLVMLLLVMLCRLLANFQVFAQAANGRTETENG